MRDLEQNYKLPTRRIKIKIATTQPTMQRKACELTGWGTCCVSRATNRTEARHQRVTAASSEHSTAHVKQHRNDVIMTSVE